MKAGIVVVGDEILDGLIEEKNSVLLLKRLANYGFLSGGVIEVRDEEDLIKEAIRFLWDFVDVVFVCGGLGPTEDDRTREAVSSFLKVPLVLNTEVLDVIYQRLKERGKTPLKEHEKMAYVPEGSEVLVNPIGLAPAFICESGGKRIVALPGVPREFEAFLDEVFRRLAGGVKGMAVVKVFKTVGLRESEVNRIVKDAIGSFPVKWGTVLKDAEVWVNVKLDDESLRETVFSSIRNALGWYLYGEDDESLEVLVGKLLKERGLTLSTAESCTGGLLSNLITNVSGSSDYFKGGVVSYLEEIKVNVLGVSWDTIKEHTVYSHQVAQEMASGVRTLMGSDIALSTTGIAGPTGGTPEKPVGLVYIGIATPDTVESFEFRFSYDRLGNKMAFAKAALDVLRRYLLKV